MGGNTQSFRVFFQIMSLESLQTHRSSFFRAVPGHGLASCCGTRQLPRLLWSWPAGGSRCWGADAVLTEVAIPQEQPPVKTLTLLAEVGRLKFHQHS